MRRKREKEEGENEEEVLKREKMSPLGSMNYAG